MPQAEPNDFRSRCKTVRVVSTVETLVEIQMCEAPGCREIFTPRANKRWCSDACRQAARAARRERQLAASPAVHTPRASLTAQ